MQLNYCGLLHNGIRIRFLTILIDYWSTHGFGLLSPSSANAFKLPLIPHQKMFCGLHQHQQPNATWNIIHLLLPTIFQIYCSFKMRFFESQKMFKREIVESETNPSARCPPWRCCGCPWGGSCTRPPPPHPTHTLCKSPGLQCSHPQTWKKGYSRGRKFLSLNTC